MRESAIAKAARPWERAGCCLISLLLCGLSLMPAHASAGSVPFYASNKAAQVMCIQCDGPWFRTSREVPIPPGTVNEHFYDAGINIFSPFGEWTCVATPNDCEGGDRFTKVNFCLDEAVEDDLELTLEADLSVTVNAVPPPCTAMAAAAFLGDASPAGQPHRRASSAGRLDRDVFRFDGEAGETITVTLEPDGAEGGSGEIAELILRAQHGQMLDTQSGALPLDLTVTLPETGSYDIEAGEVGKTHAGPDNPFRGHYRLTVASDAGQTRGASLLLEPAESTEP